MVRNLRTAYLAGLAVIACAIIGGQVVERVILGEDTATNSTLVNIAGKQRFISQQIAKAALADRNYELKEALEHWQSNHRALLEGDEALGLTGEMPAEIRAQYGLVEPHFRAISNAARDIIDNPGDNKYLSLETILQHERPFLDGMNSIVQAHAQTGDARVEMLEQTEPILAGLILAILLFEALVLFEPLLRELRGTWHAVEESETRFRLAVKGSSDAIWDWDLTTDVFYISPRFAEIIGIKPHELGSSPDTLLARIEADHREQFRDQLDQAVADPELDLAIEVRVKHADGSDRWILCRAAEHRNEEGQAVRILGSITDTTEIRNYREKLRRLAEQDALTGLPNRDLFRDALEYRLNLAANLSGDPPRFAVLFLDFDRFKTINDSLGHNIGDGLLISFAQRITAHLPKQAVVARFGGDEFAVLIEGASDAEIQGMGECLIEVLSAPHTVEQHEIISTASIGLVHSDPRYTSADKMLRDADIAMYEAKRAGRSRLVVFNTEMRAAVVEQEQLERELKRDYVVEQMRVEYQPIYNLENGLTVGFEALTRWCHPTLGEISPAKFVPIAEECGAMNAIGEWMLNTAVNQLVAWDRHFPGQKLRMSINISRKQVLQPDIVQRLARVRDKHPGMVSRMVLEITETAVIDERVDLTPILQQISDLGFPLAIDDFGTGYSSLSCLHSYPMTYLKIDRSFLLDLEQRREFVAVLAAIVSLANALDLKVIAEGIETPEQLAQLQSMGCEFGQGFLFSKSLTPRQATDHLASGHATRPRQLARAA